ncbi:MAG: hypothetical protein HFJ50_00925 [Clostridia bacterium]|jgi:hypothetical protein|nr:hypothetical protein [Clostridia bacterium]
MLKRKVFIVFMFAISIYSFLNVAYASNYGIVYLTSKQKEVKQGEQIEITINLKDSKIAACNLQVYFEDMKVEFISDINKKDVPENINLTKNHVNFVWFDELGGEGAKDGEIATFKFLAKENGLVTFTIAGDFYNQKGQSIQTEFKEVQVKIGEQIIEEQSFNLEDRNSNLQVLRVDREGLIPNFEKDIQEYYLNISKEVNFIDVLAISENPNAVIEIKGNENIQDKLSDITIKVTSADKKETKIYTIHVSKTNDLELANTNLEILAIENVLLNPPFDSSNTNYEIEVSNQTESLNIFAIPENEKATVEIIGKDNLKPGNNLVVVSVKAQDGFTLRNYRINVNRRNLIEEKKYQEQQEKQKEDLENAYNIEKTSLAINSKEEQLVKKQNKNYEAIAIWSGLILVAIFVIFGIRLIIRKKIKAK